MAFDVTTPKLSRVILTSRWDLHQSTLQSDGIPTGAEIRFCAWGKELRAENAPSLLWGGVIAGCQWVGACASFPLRWAVQRGQNQSNASPSSHQQGVQAASEVIKNCGCRFLLLLRSKVGIRMKPCCCHSPSLYLPLPHAGCWMPGQTLEETPKSPSCQEQRYKPEEEVSGFRWFPTAPLQHFPTASQAQHFPAPETKQH